MRKVNIFAITGATEKDNETMLDHNDKDIEMFIDEYGRVFNEGGQYIANAIDVEPGDGIGC